MLGTSPPPGLHHVMGAIWILCRPWTWAWGTILTAVGTVICLLGGKRLHPLFPGAVVATLLGCAAAGAGLPVGATVGAVTAGIPQLVDPRLLPWHLLKELAAAAAVSAWRDAPLCRHNECCSVHRRVFRTDARLILSCGCELRGGGRHFRAIRAGGRRKVGPQPGAAVAGLLKPRRRPFWRIPRRRLSVTVRAEIIFLVAFPSGTSPHTCS